MLGYSGHFPKSPTVIEYTQMLQGVTVDVMDWPPQPFTLGVNDNLTS